MKSYKTLAIVIKVRDFFEADRLLVLYSKDLGKISVKTRGAKRIKNKLSGNHDLLNVCEFLITQGKSIDTVMGSVLEKSFKEVKKDLKKISISYYFLELVNRLTFEKERHENIFYLLVGSMEILGGIETEKDFDILKSVFEFKLLDELGHKPKFEKCVSCGNSYSDKVYFDFEHGGVLCSDCEGEKISHELVDIKTLKTINAFDKLDINKVFNSNIGGEHLSKALDLIKKFNKYTFKNNYKSEGFLEKVESLT